MIARRSFLAGLGALVAAPAVIRTPGLLMPVRAVPVGLSLEPETLGSVVFVDEPLDGWSALCTTYYDLFMPGIRGRMSAGKTADDIRREWSAQGHLFNADRRRGFDAAAAYVDAERWFGGKQRPAVAVAGRGSVVA